MDIMYGFPVAGWRHPCARARNESKWDWRSVHGIAGEYLKRTMCVIGVDVGWVKTLLVGVLELILVLVGFLRDEDEARESGEGEKESKETLCDRDLYTLTGLHVE
jgi:hypothetical protein